MPRILIADDDVAIRRLLDRLLRIEGYETVTASNGREALDEIEREAPDLLLLDLMMPIMSGWEVYHHLRAEGPARLPIIVLTAGQRLSRAQTDLPDAEVIAKPFDLEFLLGVIKQRLSPARRARAKEKKRPKRAA
jgi:CheY-like chemotaxis protein